jgi:hypothetical protein
LPLAPLLSPAPATAAACPDGDPAADELLVAPTPVAAEADPPLDPPPEDPPDDELDPDPDEPLAGCDVTEEETVGAGCDGTVTVGFVTLGTLTDGTVTDGVVTPTEGTVTDGTVTVGEGSSGDALLASGSIATAANIPRAAAAVARANPVRRPERERPGTTRGSSLIRGLHLHLPGIGH